MRHRTQRRAFTLVEMLVVVAIISILTAIAVPTLNRIGVFGRDPLNVASRQVLTMLKAARIYAGTHNVDAAVVYAVNVQKDSATGQIIQVLDGAAIVRRLKPEELTALASNLQAGVAAGELDPTDVAERLQWAARPSEQPGMLPFIPIKGSGTLFTPLQQGAVVAAYIPNPLPEGPFVVDVVDSWYKLAGLCPIRVVGPELEFIQPRNAQCAFISNINVIETQNRFPAHVFKPSGVLQAPTKDRSRYELAVVPTPQADVDDRFYTDPNNGNKSPLPAERIEIFGTIGRIQSIDREPVT